MYFTRFIAVPFAMLALTSAAPAGKDHHAHEHDKNTTSHQHSSRATEDIFYSVPCPAGVAKHSSNSSSLDRRYNIGGVFFCNEPNWKGMCPYQVLQLGECYNVSPELDWASSIAAVGPDPGFKCTLYSGANLAGDSIPIAYPGIADLSAVGWGPNTENEVLGITCFSG
jgi:hypothetical protein